MPPDPHTGEGLRRPSPDPTPSANPALRASVPRSGPLAPPSSSLCVVDILIYFRRWVMALTMLSVQSCCRRRSVRSQVLRRRIKMLPLISSLIQSYCYSEAILWPLGDDNRLRRGALTQSKQVRWRCSVRGGGGCVSHLGLGSGSG